MNVILSFILSCCIHAVLAEWEGKTTLLLFRLWSVHADFQDGYPHCLHVAAPCKQLKVAAFVFAVVC